MSKQFRFLVIWQLVLSTLTFLHLKADEASHTVHRAVLMEAYAACPFATHLGFSCVLWRQGTAAAATCRVTLETRGRQTTDLFLSAAGGLGRARKSPVGPEMRGNL